jgi:hypothetical protein
MNTNEIERCKEFIRDNFNNIPSINEVMLKSLFFSGGTFTDKKIISQAIKTITR